MCGITGAILKKKSKTYWNLLKESEIRGQDGTGVTWVNFDETLQNFSHFNSLRSDKKASLLDEQLFDEGSWVIGQNRLAVFGLDSINNQPLIGNNNFALVHNGNLFQFEEAFERLNLKRKYEVDSELILRFIEDKNPQNTDEIFQCIGELFEEVKGNMACILLRRISGDMQMIAFARYKPLFMFENDEGKFLFSTKEIGREIFGEQQFLEIPNNHCLITDGKVLSMQDVTKKRT